MKPGTQVGAERWPYDHAHPDCWQRPLAGEVLEVTDPRAWANTIAFPVAISRTRLPSRATLRDANMRVGWTTRFRYFGSLEKYGWSRPHPCDPTMKTSPSGVSHENSNSEEQMAKSMSLPDFLTQEQIDAAWALYQKAQPGTFARQCSEQIIQPNMAEINRKLGQENDASYLAYACEYVFMQMPQTGSN